MLEIEILKLIYDYSIKGQIVDKNFFDKIIEIFVKEKGLNDYIKNLRFIDKKEQDLDKIKVASYYPIEKTIAIYYQAINSVMDDYSSHYSPLFNTLEKTMLINLTISQLLLHELEHACQFKMSNDKNNNTIEAKLSKVCFALPSIINDPVAMIEFFETLDSPQKILEFIKYNEKEMYTRYYDINPSETLAEVKSQKLIVKSIEPIKTYIPSLYEFQSATLIEKLIKSYTKTTYFDICPTQEYLSAMNEQKVWTSFDFYSDDYNELIKNVRKKYDLETRCALGLPISTEEFVAARKFLLTTNKYKI